MPEQKYALYLRKSRADLESEHEAGMDVLQRQENTLMELAEKNSMAIKEVYREIVSGDSIAARPQMQKLLAAVEGGFYEGVLVMDVDRLARGDTMDQGFVAQTFKYANTKIITPMKTYDPNNEFDEEYFEFGLFMSRREYKIINRRLQRGRLASVKEGKYAASRPPYGYERVRLPPPQKGWTLRIIEAEANVVAMIFAYYIRGEIQEDGIYKRLGTTLIAKRLNALCIKPQRGERWAKETIRDILINPVYTGKVRWNNRPVSKKMVGGQIRMERPRSESSIIARGLHQPIIDEATFDTAQKLMAENPPRPVGKGLVPKNPLAGIVICGKCGKHMVRRPYQNDKPAVLLCANNSCSNVSTAIHFVEERILEALEKWLTGYEIQWNGAKSKLADTALQELTQKHRAQLDQELIKLEKQRNKVYDLYEQGEYPHDIFTDRLRNVTEKIDRIQEARTMAIANIDQAGDGPKAHRTALPERIKIVELYQALPTAAEKNDLLKDLLEKAVYIKESDGRRQKSFQDNFQLTLYPKLPRKEQ